MRRIKLKVRSTPDDTGLQARLRLIGLRILVVMAGLALAGSETIAADYGFGTKAAQPALEQSLLPTLVAAQSAAKAAALDAAILQPILPAPSRPLAVGADPGKGFVRLPGHMLKAAATAQMITPAADGRHDRLNLTLSLKRDNEEAFDRYLGDVYDPQSPHFRHFLSQSQLTQRFGPSRQAYLAVVNYAKARGLHLVAGSRNRMTVTVRGSRATVQRAFNVQLMDYQLGTTQFYASNADPALPLAIARHVSAISGLSNLSVPHAVTVDEALNYCGAVTSVFGVIIIVPWLALTANILGALCTGIQIGLHPEQPLNYCGIIGSFKPLWTAIINAICNGIQIGQDPYRGFGQTPGSGNGANPPGGRPGGGSHSVKSAASSSGRSSMKRASSNASTPPDGTGQTIGLLEFDTFARSDVSDYLNVIGGAPGQIDNLSEVNVNGGVATPGPNQDEVLLDIAVTMAIAPAAKVVVYDAPFDGTSAGYVSLFNQMINDKVTVISNSWASCEDQVSQADAQAIDAVLKSAAASGVSVFNGTGDSGAGCLDGSPNTVAVPADSPNATAVGGTTLKLGIGYVYDSETWWNGSTATPASGQGGYGVSKYFARPSYQAGVNTAANRSVPDVSVDADPSSGYLLCEAANGGCPNGQIYAGTSASAPTWASFAALLNQASGKQLGSFNPLLYPLANTTAFHTASSMGSDFAHVGLGSPNLDLIYLQLNHLTVGTADAAVSNLYYESTIRGGVQNSPLFTVPADGTTAAVFVITLRDANGNTVSGKTVSLTTQSTSAHITTINGVTTVADGSAVFEVTDATPEKVSVVATDTTDGMTLTQGGLVVFGVPTAASAGITANPASAPADGQTAATIVVTLKDSQGRPTPGKTVTLSDAGAHAVITGPTPAVTDANGLIQFSATDQVNETVTFTAVDVSDNNLPVPGSATVTYSGSSATACGVGVAPVPGTGYAISSYITGLPAAANLYYGNANIGCPGGNNPAFTSAGGVLVSDFETGGIYQLGLVGGTASNSNLLNTLNPALGNLVYGKDGNVYATSGNGGAQVIQVDPATGAMLRVVASGLTCPAGLSVDPLSGDLFFDDQCTGGGDDDPTVYRIIDPANTDAANPTLVVPYASLPTTPNGGMAFAPNGTLYAVSGYYKSTTAQVQQISATNVMPVTVTAVTGVTSDYGIAIGVTNADGSAQSLIVEPAGVLTEIPIANPGAAQVLASVSPGVGVVGPDGCLYSAKYDTIYRLANSAGGCGFAPTSPAPALSLSPTTVSPNPAQGGSQTFTATLKNVSPLAGVAVYFQVSGVNEQVKVVNTDANGNATLTYPGVLAGSDTVLASTTAGTTSLLSNVANVDWTTGKHTAFLTLSAGPRGGMVGQSVTVVASLADISVNPTAAVAGQPVTLTLDGASCTAASTAGGIASCALTPSKLGTGTLTATFAGSSQLTAATDSIGFNVFAPSTPAPTVSITVNPTSIAAGSAAVLTWSSTNATACTASGAWSGAQATSGTLSVTPAATGSYSYTLTCTGSGGSGTATAVLSATLVAVTVTAKSGGGAFSWWLLAFLGLLVLLRVTASPRGGARSVRIGAGIGVVAALLTVAAVDTARADASTDSSAGPSAALDPVYFGIRVGSMPVRQDAGRIDAGLAARGFVDVTAGSDTSGTAGTVFVGYEFTPRTGIEVDYTHRNATAAHLAGSIPSAASLTPLLQDTTDLIRGYGNIVALCYAGRFEVLPRFRLEPRLGGFFWATKVEAVGLDDRIDTTHEGGGVTAGATAAYRVWGGLELGLSVDHYRGSPHNIATLYGGTLLWRFGR